MKNFAKNSIWKLVCAFIVCAGIAISFATCSKDDDDDECKTCTNKVTNVTIKACSASAIKDAEDLGMTCK